jgi:hypothetical protein
MGVMTSPGEASAVLDGGGSRLGHITIE